MVEEANVDAENAVIEPTYPEHEKLEKVSKTSQQIGEFLEWMTTRNPKPITFCILELDMEDCYPEDQYMPARESIAGLLAQYFEIDLDVIETEKRAMLQSLRDHQRGITPDNPDADLRERQRAYLKRREANG